MELIHMKETLGQKMYPFCKIRLMEFFSMRLSLRSDKRHARGFSRMKLGDSCPSGSTRAIGCSRSLRKRQII